METPGFEPEEWSDAGLGDPRYVSTEELVRHSLRARPGGKKGRRGRLYSFYSSNSLTDLEFEFLQNQEQHQEATTYSEGAKPPTATVPPTEAPLSSAEISGFMPFSEMEERLRKESQTTLLEYFSEHVHSKEDTIHSLLHAAHQDPSIHSALSKSLGRQRELSHEWNERFQRLLREKEDSAQKFRMLADLAQAFVFTAEQYGRLLIYELHFPIHKKTIKPVSIGGRAGGDKYIADGILFKFCLDTPTGMYRGDANAMKAAGHELRGLIHYHNCNLDLLLTPLQAVVDFRGYRLTASSLLPISHDTIIYGSADGGQTMHSSDPVCNELMEQAAEQLHLRKHNVFGHQLCCSGDTEVHRGYDGKYYLVDTARVFPPEAPSDPSNGHKIWFQMLRPELLVRLNVRLSSDAFSGWQSMDPSWQELNDDVIKATRALFDEIIPQYTESLKKRLLGEKRAFFDTTRIVRERSKIAVSPLFQSLEKRIFEQQRGGSDDVIPEALTNFSLTHDMHKNGINMRHLGRIRMYVKNLALRKLLLTEMVARFAKQLLRQIFRECLDPTNDVSMKRVVVEFFNEILYPPVEDVMEEPIEEEEPSPPSVVVRPATNDSYSTFGVEVTKEQEYAKQPKKTDKEKEKPITNTKACDLRFWSRAWRVQLAEKFEHGLSNKELKGKVCLADRVDMGQLFSRLCYMTGVILSQSVVDELAMLSVSCPVHASPQPLSLQRIPEVELSSGSKTRPLKRSYPPSDQHSATPLPESLRFEFVEPDIIGFCSIVKHMNIVDYSEAYALHLQALSKAKGRERMRLLQLAGIKFEKALQSAPNNYLALYRMGWVLTLQAELERDPQQAMGLLDRAIENFNHCIAIKNNYYDAHLLLGKALIDQGIIYGREHSQDKENGKDFSLDKFERGAKHFIRMLETNPALIAQLMNYAKEYYHSYNRKRRKVENLGLGSPSPTPPSHAPTEHPGSRKPEKDIRHRVRIAIEPSDSSSVLSFDQLQPPLLRNAPTIIGASNPSPPSPTASGSAVHLSAPAVQWSWLDDDNCWQAYSPALNSYIENSFLAGEKFIHFDSHKYFIDFETLTQTRLKTSTKRKVKRDIVHPHVPQPRSDGSHLRSAGSGSPTAKRSIGKKNWKLVGAMTICFAVRKYAQNNKKRLGEQERAALEPKFVDTLKLWIKSLVRVSISLVQRPMNSPTNAHLLRHAPGFISLKGVCPTRFWAAAHLIQHRVKELLQLDEGSLNWVTRGVLRMERKIQSKPFMNDMYLVIGEVYSAIEASGILSPEANLPRPDVEGLYADRLRVLLKMGNAFLRFYPTQNSEYKLSILTRASKAFKKALAISGDVLNDMLDDCFSQKTKLSRMLWLCLKCSPLRLRFLKIVKSQTGVLRVLDLSCCGINDDTLLLLKDHAHLIESLNLSYCAQITDFCLPQLFRKHPDGRENRLQKCDLSYTLIGQFTVNALLGCCPHLHSLTLEKCRNVKQLTLDEWAIKKVSAYNKYRTGKLPQPATWSWCDPSGWTPFDRFTSVLIEKGFLRNAEKVQIDDNRFIDFNSMYLRRLDNASAKRKVRRVVEDVLGGSGQHHHTQYHPPDHHHHHQHHHKQKPIEQRSPLTPVTAHREKSGVNYPNPILLEALHRSTEQIGVFPVLPPRKELYPISSSYPSLTSSLRAGQKDKDEKEKEKEKEKEEKSPPRPHYSTSLPLTSSTTRIPTSSPQPATKAMRHHRPPAIAMGGDMDSDDEGDALNDRDSDTSPPRRRKRLHRDNHDEDGGSSDPSSDGDKTEEDEEEEEEEDQEMFMMDGLGSSSEGNDQPKGDQQSVKREERAGSVSLERPRAAGEARKSSIIDEDDLWGEVKKLSWQSTMGDREHLPLRALELLRCPNFSGAALVGVLPYFSHLTSLKLVYMSLPSAVVGTILSHCTRLKELSLAGNVAVTDESLKGLSVLKDLEVLSLRDCFKVSDITFTSYLPKLASPKPGAETNEAAEKKHEKIERHHEEEPDVGGRLRTLDVSGTRIEFEGIQSVLRTFANLKELNVSNCKGISTDGVGAILLASNLEKISLYNLLAVQPTEQTQPLPPEKLHSHHPTSEERQESFIQFIKRLPVLRNATSLDVGKLPFPEKGIKPLLKKIPNVRHLSMRDVQMLRNAAVTKMFLHCPHITSLDLSQIPQVSDASISGISRLTQLKIIKLSRCWITDKAVIHGISKCKKLEEIDVSFCSYLTSAAISSLASSIPRLRWLNIASCVKMDDLALTAISHSVDRPHKRLQGKLKTKNGAAAAAQRADILEEEAVIAKKHRKNKQKKNKWLTYLDVSDCRSITNAGVKALRNACNLKVLKLGGCDRVHEKALVKLIHVLNKLQDLDLRDLELSDDAIVYIVEHSPQLFSVNLQQVKGNTRMKHLNQWLESEASHINVGTGRNAITPTKLLSSKALLKPATPPLKHQ